MSIVAILLLVLAFILVALLTFGLCKVAARADEQSEQCYNEMRARIPSSCSMKAREFRGHGRACAS